MFTYSNKKKCFESMLYNKILLLSRNKLLYTDFNLKDTFQNRINLIFFHSSFLFIKTKHQKSNFKYKDFYQKMFDFMFKKIEQNMRELGWGDVTVNKKMKQLVKDFYNILLTCEKYQSENTSSRNLILHRYLQHNKKQNYPNNKDLTEYFDKYLSFCIDLTQDNVLKGDLNFEFK